MLPSRCCQHNHILCFSVCVCFLNMLLKTVEGPQDKQSNLIVFTILLTLGVNIHRWEYIFKFFLSVWYLFPQKASVEGAWTVWIHSEAPSYPLWTSLSLSQHIFRSVNELWKLTVREVNIHWETNSTWHTLQKDRRHRDAFTELESHCQRERWI